MKKRFHLLELGVLLWVTASAIGDVVVTRDGLELKGRVEKKDNRVIIHLHGGGEVRLPLEKVVRIVPDDEASATKPKADKQKAKKKTVTSKPTPKPKPKPKPGKVKPIKSFPKRTRGKLRLRGKDGPMVIDQRCQLVGSLILEDGFELRFVGDKAFLEISGGLTIKGTRKRPVRIIGQPLVEDERRSQIALNSRQPARKLWQKHRRTMEDPHRRPRPTPIKLEIRYAILDNIAFEGAIRADAIRIEDTVWKLSDRVRSSYGLVPILLRRCRFLPGTQEWLSMHLSSSYAVRIEDCFFEGIHLGCSLNDHWRARRFKKDKSFSRLSIRRNRILASLSLRADDNCRGVTVQNNEIGWEESADKDNRWAELKLELHSTPLSWSRNNVRVSKTELRSTAKRLNLAETYWGTTDQAELRKLLRAIGGARLDYQPVLSAPLRLPRPAISDGTIMEGPHPEKSIP